MHLVYSKNKNSLFYLFFLFFILEVCLGGAGGIFKFGPLTLRKVNFVVIILIMIFIFLKIKLINKEILFFTIGQILLLVLATVLGLITYENHQKVFENLLMQSFFIILPLYSFFINSESKIKIVSNILTFSSLLMAIIYIYFLLSIFVFNWISFDQVYDIVSESDEIMGRGDNAFFYKGFLYMCLGVYFLESYQNTFFKRIGQIIVLIAIYLTYSRGFLLALVLAVLIYFLLRKKIIISSIILGLGILVVSLFNKSYSEASFDRGESDQVRVIQVQQVMDRITPVSFFIGHGFGEGVPIRDNHMEINFLELFHKQGILGLIFWIIILTYVIALYLRTIHSRRKERIARPFLLGSIFVYIESITNPFLTSSIGMNMVMLSLVSLKVLGQKKIENE